MTDVYDRSAAIEIAEWEALQQVAPHKPTMPAVCACYNCGEELAPGLVFCDRDCRDDYEKRHPQQK
jgi:hypothetical protein